MEKANIKISNATFCVIVFHLKKNLLVKNETFILIFKHSKESELFREHFLDHIRLMIDFSKDKCGTDFSFGSQFQWIF